MEGEPHVARDHLLVLYVEDDEDYFVLLREILAEVDPEMELVWAAGPAEARALAARNRYDAVLVDCRLGAESGITLLREWRAAGFSGPMVMVTGSDDAGLADEARAAGADEALIKAHPFAEAVQRSIRDRIGQRDR